MISINDVFNLINFLSNNQNLNLNNFSDHTFKQKEIQNTSYNSYSKYESILNSLAPLNRGLF
jgi:hypothetical protein